MSTKHKDYTDFDKFYHTPMDILSYYLPCVIAFICIVGMALIIEQSSIVG